MRLRYKASFLVGDTPESDRPTVEAVATAARNWAAERLPAAAQLDLMTDGRVEDDHGGSFEIVRLAGAQPVWGARIVHRDASDEYVRWICEITITGEGRAQVFSCTVALGSMDGVCLPLRRARTRPGLVPQVLKAFGGRRHQPLRTTPTVVATADVKCLVAALQDPKRTRPIVFIAARSGGTTVDATELADKLAGIAHVYVGSDQATNLELQQHLPTELWCGDGAVRVYWPRMIETNWTQHRIWRATEIDRAPRALPELVLTHVAEAAAYSNEVDDVSWSDIQSRRRAEVASQLREQGDMDELIRVVEEENKIAKQRVAEAELELEVLRAELETTRASERAWKEWYERQVAGEQVEKVSTLAPPTTVREAVERAIGEHSERLTLELNGKSDLDTPYAEPEEVYEAVKFLATTYHASRTGEEPCADFDAALRKATGWFYRGSQSELTMSKYEPWYTTHLDGEKLWLGQHVGVGKSKDARYTIRIAFTWHAKTKRVVIGFIGQHQETDQT